MVRKGFKVMDSDMHVMEPPDLWQRYIDPQFKDRAPRGPTPQQPTKEQGIWSGAPLVHPDGQPWGIAPVSDRVWQMRRTGRNFTSHQERIKPYEERGWTGEVQLGAMDEEGIDVAVLYPSRGLYALPIPDMEPRLAAAVAQAYNDWLYDFCQADPSRLLGAAMVSPFDVEDAVSESRRCVRELGFTGVFLRPNEVNGRNWHDPYYEPLWSTLEELGVPLGFHEGVGSAMRTVGEQFGDNDLLRHVFSHPGEQMLAVGSFCVGGVLERHPNLKVAFLEANCSWLPFLVWRMDEHWERQGDVYAPELKMAPSEYFKRQCFASAEADEDPIKYVVDYLGSDRLVFSTDFPHSDSKFPRSVDAFLELPIGDEDKGKILWDNCARYYGIE